MRRLRPAAWPLVLVLVLLLGACGSDPPRPAARPSPMRPGELTVVAVGDSITEADSPDFDDGALGPGSWATYAGGDGVHVLGGWAHAGATTEDILNGLPNAPFRTADVLVLMAGNNDLDQGVPPTAIEDALVRIAAGVRAGKVVLSTVAPDAAAAAAVARLNARLPALARREGWRLVDPMRAVSDGRGHYLPGMSDDGVHPTRSAARLIGLALREALTT